MEQYRYAKAYEQVAADIIQYIHSLQGQGEYLLEKERDKTDLDKA